MKTLASSLALLVGLTFSGCGALTNFENGGGVSKVDPVLKNSAAGQVGQGLDVAAQQALAAYAKAKIVGVDYVWGLEQAFNAYATLVKTQDDVKALVAQWDGTASEGLADRLASLFGASSGTTTERMFALARAAQNTAAAYQA